MLLMPSFFIGLYSKEGKGAYSANFTNLKSLQNTYTVEISDREKFLEIKGEIGYTKRRKKWETKTICSGGMS